MGTNTEAASWGYAQAVNGRANQEDRAYLAHCPPLDDAEAAELLRRCVSRLDEVTRDHLEHGSTFTGAVVTRHGNIVTAHLGDSPAAAFVYDPRTGAMEVSRLTMPHTPSIATRHFAIHGQHWRERGGRVEVPGVPGSISVNRALGDMQYGSAVSKEAEIALHDVARFHAQGKTVFLMLASDGIIVGRDLERSLAGLAETLRGALSDKAHDSLTDHAGRLVQHCLRPGGDNVTVTLTEVKPGRGVFAAVLDGHGGARTADVAAEELQRILSAPSLTPATGHLATHPFSPRPVNRLGRIGILAAIGVLGGWVAYEVARRRRGEPAEPSRTPHGPRG